MDNVILLGHTATTLVMAGVMWTVQLVVYPQFQSVAPENFSNYLGQHSNRIVAVLILFAPLEVLFSLALWIRGANAFELASWTTFVAGLLLVIAWLSTGLFFGPFHGRLQSEPHDLAAIGRLIKSNWIRTLLWTARAGFALGFVGQAL